MQQLFHHPYAESAHDFFLISTSSRSHFITRLLSIQFPLSWPVNWQPQNSAAMDLCSAELYVERSEISGLFNHGAFWNKLSISPNARQPNPLQPHICSIALRRKGPREYKVRKKSSSAASSRVPALTNRGMCWFVLSVQDFEGFPNLFFFFFFNSFAFFVLREIPECFLSVVLGTAEPCSRSPPHWVQISAFWRQANETKHGAICSPVMHHRLTADIISAPWSVYACMCGGKRCTRSTFISSTF